MKYLGVFLLMGLLSACATQTVVEPVPEQSTPAETQSLPGYTPPQPTASPPKATPAPLTISIAAESLAQLARTQYQAKQYQSAIATAERGLRIERRAASLYLVLAQSYVQLGLPDKAKNFVQQGLRYATPESDQEIQLLRLRDILSE